MPCPGVMPRDVPDDAPPCGDDAGEDGSADPLRASSADPSTVSLTRACCTSLSLAATPDSFRDVLGLLLVCDDASSVLLWFDGVLVRGNVARSGLCLAARFRETPPASASGRDAPGVSTTPSSPDAERISAVLALSSQGLQAQGRGGG